VTLVVDLGHVDAERPVVVANPGRAADDSTARDVDRLRAPDLDPLDAESSRPSRRSS
jgi:hypothetical protein